MTGQLPLFFKETIEVMLNLCLTVYIYICRFEAIKALYVSKAYNSYVFFV